MKDKESSNNFSNPILKGLIVDLMILVPSLSAFGISWYLFEDLIQASIIGVVVHLIAMGISFKISKKLFLKNIS